MTTEQFTDNLTKAIVDVICPVCNKKGILKIPIKIVNESQNLTTVSVPTGIICKDNFQAYVDKNFSVRGYQKVDFEVNNIEYMDDEIDTFTSKEKFDKIKTILRENIRKDYMIGTGIYSATGKTIFTSIPYDSLIYTLRDIEVKNNGKAIRIKRMHIELENGYLIFIEIIDIDNQAFIIMILFSEFGKIGLANLVVKRIVAEIEKL